MANVLFLVHRIPFPPNKGDKVRSYHLLKHLALLHSVYLGAFVDDPEDEQYIPKVKEFCVDSCFRTLHRSRARLRSLKGLATGEALGVCYYNDSELHTWVLRLIQKRKIDAAVIYSSLMAQYVVAPADVPTVVDFVDVDSAKWAEYGLRRPWPLSWLYRREGRKLLAYEREVAARATHSFFVTERESQLFTELAPECSPRVSVVGNGVDSQYFSFDSLRSSPYSSDVVAPIVFTGAMDYWPNIDAVVWFAREVFPALCALYNGLVFYVVGRNPPEAVRSLASNSVVVTGTVPDVRPYLQHAGVVVAPLRIARGIQNKILEAMAMERPVVASTACVNSLGSMALNSVMSATTPLEFVEAIKQLLASPNLASGLGKTARQHVVQHFDWGAQLATIDKHIAVSPAQE